MTSSREITSSVVLTRRIDPVAVWGATEGNTTELPCTTFEEAMAIVLEKKAEGFEIAYVREDPLSAIEDSTVGPVPLALPCSEQ